MLVVTNQGEVSNAVVDIPADSSLDEMQLLADRMNHFLHGREIDNTDEQLILSFQKDVERDLTPYMHVFKALQKTLQPPKEVYAGGASQLIEQPEFKNVEKMQDILNLLEQRDMLESMLLSSSDQPIAVHIPFGPFHCPRAVFLGRPHYRLSRRPGAYEDAVQQDHRNDAVHAAETGYFIEEE